MGGKPKASNERLVFVLPRVVVAWIDAEAGRLGVTKSAVMRGAAQLVPLAAVIGARRGGR